MTTHRITTHQQDAPFIIPGNALAALLAMAAEKVHHWLRTRHEKRRQRRDMQHVRARETRILRDIGLSRWEITSLHMQERMARWARARADWQI